MMIWLVLIGLSLWSHPCVPDAPCDTPVFTVRLTDEAEQPVAGVRVELRDAAGVQSLLTAETDAAGQVAFATVPESPLRVAVQGQLGDGTPLFQDGQDATGVWVDLGGTPFTLLLRVADDGWVVPDPALWAVELPDDTPAPASTEELPTAVVAPPVSPADAEARAAPPSSEQPMADGPAPTPAASPMPWWALAVVVLGVLALGSVVVVLYRLRSTW